MSELRAAPYFDTHRAVALNPLVPDVADPANSPAAGVAFGFESHEYTHAMIYWTATGGAIATDDDNVTFRIITYDYINNVWVRVKTVTLRHQERCIVPVMEGGIFVRVDAEATTATAMDIRVCGYTPRGGDLSDQTGYTRLQELGAGFAPGGAGGIADTGFVFGRDVAAITELFYEDSAGNITQLTSAGAAGLQLAYDIDDSIVTTAADGYIEFSRGATSAAAQGVLQMTDDGLAANVRTAALVDINDQEVLGVPGRVPTVLVQRNNVTNTPIWLQMLSTADAANGPLVEFCLRRATPGPEDIGGTISFYAYDSVPNETEYFRLRAVAERVVSTQETGRLDFFAQRNDAINRVLGIKGRAQAAAGEDGVIFQSNHNVAGQPQFEYRTTANIAALQPTVRYADADGAQFLVDFQGDGRVCSQGGILLSADSQFTVAGVSPNLRSIVADRTAVAAAAASQAVGGYFRSNASCWTGAAEIRRRLDVYAGVITTADESAGPVARLAIDYETYRLLEIISTAAAPAAVPGAIFRNSAPAGTIAFSFRAAQNPGAATTHIFEYADGTDAFGVLGDGTAFVVGGSTAARPGFSRQSDLNTGVYFDAADTVGFAAGAFGAFTVAHAVGNNPTTAIIASDGAGAVGSELRLYQNSGTPAQDDNVGIINFYGQDSGGNPHQYAQILGDIRTTLNGSEDGAIWMDISIAGTTHTADTDMPWKLHANAMSATSELGGGCGVVKGYKGHANAGVDDARYQRTGTGTWSDGAAHALDYFWVADYTAYWVKCHVVAYGTSIGSGKGYKAWELWTLALRDGGGVQFGVGGAVVQQTDDRGDVNLWAAVLVPNGNYVDVSVTGQNGQTINWSCYWEYQLAEDPT